MTAAQEAERLERVSWETRREGLLKSRERAGYLFTMGAIVVYGLMPTMVRLIYDMSELTPLQLSFWRFALSAPVLWFISLGSPPNHRPFSPRARASMRRTVLVGLFYGLSSVIAFQSLLYIPAGVFILLFYTFPIIVVSVSRLLGERLPKVFWISLLLTLSGVALTAISELSGVGEMGDEALLGVMFALLGALSVAIYFILNQRILRGHGGVTRGVVWILTSAGITLFVVTQLAGQGIGLDAIGDAWAILLLFGICGTSFSVYMLNLGIQRLGAARTAVVATFEPIFALFFAWALMGELLKLPQFLGGALIMSSVVLLTWRQFRTNSAR